MYVKEEPIAHCLLSSWFFLILKEKHSRKRLFIRFLTRNLIDGFLDSFYWKRSTGALRKVFPSRNKYVSWWDEIFSARQNAPTWGNMLPCAEKSFFTRHNACIYYERTQSYVENASLRCL